MVRPPKKYVNQKKFAETFKKNAKGSKQVKFQTSVKHSSNSPAQQKKVRKKKKGRPVLSFPASTADTVVGFFLEVEKYYASTIRNKMDDQAHVLYVSDNSFKNLIKDHLDVILKISKRTDDPQFSRILAKYGARKQLSKLAPVIRKKFQRILQLELRKNSALKYEFEDSVFQGSPARVYYITKAEKSIKRTVFRILRDDVFNSIRETLVKLSAKGGRGSVSSSILSVTIAGFSVPAGEDIPEGNLGNISKGLTARGAPITASGQKAKGTGFQLGHVRGPATVAADKLLAAFKEFGEGLVGFDDLYRRAAKKVGMIHAYDAQNELNDLVWNFATGKWNPGKVNISIIDLEQTAKNGISGGLAGSELRDLRDWMVYNVARILQLQGSLPIQTMLLEDIVTTFLGYKTPTRRINIRKPSRKKVVKGTTNSTHLMLGGRKNQKNINDLENIAKEKSTNTTDLNSLLNFLNSKMHDKIRENMGKGGSKQVLNYKTGRFAKSAKIQSLYEVNEKGAIGAQVKYMRYPYGVFEPGGRLHKAGRDPHRIFGRSIRQILQEERIANLRRVKVKLNG